MSQMLNPLVIRTKLIGSKEITIFSHPSDYKLTLAWILLQESQTLILYLITSEQEAQLKDFSDLSSL